MRLTTTLQLRLLKPCDSTVRLLNSLSDIPEFGWEMFRFEVKIPTKLWKAILRRRKLVSYGYTTNLTLGQAITEHDIDIRTYEADNTLDILNDSEASVRRTMCSAVYVTPLNTELFDRFDIRVLRSVALFRSPDIINFNVILHIPGGPSSAVEAIFDVSRIPDLLDRPAGALVSYAINV